MRQVEFGALSTDTVRLLPVTWHLGEEGEYRVISRYGDDVWEWPKAGSFDKFSEPQRRISFVGTPEALKDSFKELFWRYLRSDKPQGQSLFGMHRSMAQFLEYLSSLGITNLADTTPIHCLSYVNHCKSLPVSGGKNRGQPRKPRYLALLFGAVEKLQKHAAGTPFAFPHPWPDATACYLAGMSWKGGLEAGTAVIPDYAWRKLFQAARERLEIASYLLELMQQVEDLRADWRERGFNSTSIRGAVCRFLSEAGFEGSVRDLGQARGELRDAAIIVILSLSGIRAHELRNLRNNAWRREIRDDGVYYWMRSRSDKTGIGETEWMIPEIVTTALDVAQRVAQPLQERLSSKLEELEDPCCLDALNIRADVDRLFLANNTGAGNTVAAVHEYTMQYAIRRFAARRGINWDFAPHQFRRTFAVYVARSKLGDLRYLRDHMQHWSMDMTWIYARNSKQDPELFAEIDLAIADHSIEVIAHWLDEETLLSGGAAGNIRAFRSKDDKLRVYHTRREMAKTISESVYLRATGAAWCTADDGGCGGRGAVERTLCGGCSNAVIDDKKIPYWRGVYQQQLELRQINDIGDAARRRVERDLRRCEQVLTDLGVLSVIE
ncbi:MAG: tyrosine-type recombinase/integrase [Chromatiales bacterium]|nr:tyrosine-type recombinase/integrase [Chromatiales bacterium]